MPIKTSTARDRLIREIEEENPIPLAERRRRRPLGISGIIYEQAAETNARLARIEALLELIATKGH